jgi:hypothetical protein
MVVRGVAANKVSGMAGSWDKVAGLARSLRGRVSSSPRFGVVRLLVHESKGWTVALAIYVVESAELFGRELR